MNELTGEETRFERLHSGDKQLALTRQADELLAPTTRTKVLPDFVKGRTESLRGAEGPKAEHRVVALLDATMILLDRVFANDKSGFFRPPDWSAPRSGFPLPPR